MTDLTINLDQGKCLTRKFENLCRALAPATHGMPRGIASVPGRDDFAVLRVCARAVPGLFYNRQVLGEVTTAHRRAGGSFSRGMKSSAAPCDWSHQKLIDFSQPGYASGMDAT